MAEETKTAIRNSRRDANDKIKAAQKAKDLSEDDEHLYFNDIQELTNNHIKKIEEITENKKQDVMSV